MLQGNKRVGGVTIYVYDSLSVTKLRDYTTRNLSLYWLILNVFGSDFSPAVNNFKYVDNTTLYSVVKTSDVTITAFTATC